MRCLGLTLAAFVAGALSAEAAPNLNKGNWELGGNLQLSHTSEGSPYFGSSKRTLFRLGAQGQYFLADELSAGLELGLAGTGLPGPTVSAGPVLTRYLYVEDKLAPYMSMLPIRWSKAEATGPELSTGVRIGAKIFLTDSVAIGPAIDYQHDWGHGENNARDTFSFFGLFSIHL